MAARRCIMVTPCRSRHRGDRRQTGKQVVPGKAEADVEDRARLTFDRRGDA
ncbi:hypothetical protein REMIM1_PE00087 (plasmid) [Rhizobium etli bv. mimosae str. Mim1]|nr:hypothetical protein REMIM1_PE00087 [Rhizobium etli bv. mimosae str. Mim1]